MAVPAMIEVRDVRFSYPGNDNTVALENVSFNMKPGEWVVLMGANGSGKTTLVRCLNGLLIPSSGEVRVDGYSTGEADTLYEIRRKVGMIFQNPDDQIVATTVEREIAFGLENLATPHKEMVEKVEAALIRFNLGKYKNTPPHLLSGGERQRLALASVWAMSPDYYVLDEPTSLLDPEGRSEVFEFLREARESEGTGILLVTQYSEEALSGDRLIVMDKGRIVLDGKPSIVFNRSSDLRRMGLEIPAEFELQTFIEETSRAHPG